MTMKKIYKSLMAVAAALLLVPTAYAQEVLPGTDLGHEKYEIDTDKGIGYNKYLVSNTPNDDGEYTLRIENFITGKVKQHTTPTDFVLVLDCSGSMQFDYRLGLEKRLEGVDHPIDAETGVHGIPAFISVADNNRTGFLKKDDHFEGYDRYTYVGLCKNANYNVAASSFVSTNTPWFQNEGELNSSSDQCSRYYYYEDSNNASNTGYYIIYHKTTTSPTRYHLCIRLKDGTEKYLYQSSIHDTPNTVIDSNKKVIYTGDTWRMETRREALIDALGVFANQIKEENTNNDQWQANVTRHRVAIVSFGNNYQTNNSTSTSTTWSDNYLVERTNRSSNTKLVKDFTEVTSANVNTFATAVNDRMTFGGYTDIDFGMHMAMRLLAVRAGASGMAPLTPSGSTNRNKVVVVLTDGSPNNNNYNPASTITMNNALADGITIKKTGFKADGTTQEINAKIFTIDLWCNSYSPKFLGHLSSNYPDGNHTGTTTDTNNDANAYTGTIIPQWDEVNDPEHEHDLRIYYQDASKADLKEIFEKIADASTGAQTGTMAAVDVMSADFELPFTTTDVNEVTMYTAECVGMKEIDGENYLAFAEPIQVSFRDALDELWVVRPKEGGAEGETEWVNIAGEYGIDIDSKMKFTVSDDKKTIVVSGFNYADLWCGIDPDETHHNTRQMAATDPNAAFALPGYRGFKLIFEFPIVIDPDALGGVNVPTNDWAHSGLYNANSQGEPQGDPQVNYPTPDLPVPVRLIIQKTGLQAGESANFTLQRKLRTDTSAVYEDFTTFVLTGGDTTPEVRIINLDPAYYYKVKEGNWSWTYQNVSEEYYTTDPNDKPIDKNPIVFQNSPIPTVKHAEAKATNIMHETEYTTISE